MSNWQQSATSPLQPSASQGHTWGRRYFSSLGPVAMNLAWTVKPWFSAENFYHFKTIFRTTAMTKFYFKLIWISELTLGYAPTVVRGNGAAPWGLALILFLADFWYKFWQIISSIGSVDRVIPAAMTIRPPNRSKILDKWTWTAVTDGVRLVFCSMAIDFGAVTAAVMK